MTTTPKTIGAAIRAARVGRGLTQEAVAAAVGVYPSYISLLEQGRHTPGAAVCEALVRELGLDAAILDAAASRRRDHPLRTYPKPKAASAAATKGVRHAKPTLVVTLPGRNGELGTTIRRYRCAECAASVDLERDEPLPAGWHTSIHRRYGNEIEVAYHCGCARRAEREGVR